MVAPGVSVKPPFDEPLNDYKGVNVSRMIHDYYDSDAKRGFYGGGGIDARFDWSPINFALSALPPDVPRSGEGFQAAPAEYFPGALRLIAHSTRLPVYPHSVRLDTQLTDAAGL